MIILCMMCFVLPSCKCVSGVQEFRSSEVQEFSHTSQDSTHNLSLIAHTSRDSIVYREKVVHDTVYITKEVYRDTHNSSLIARNSTQADTVVVTEYRDRVVESPPQRYVPKFYRWCTIALWVIGLLAIGYGLLRLALKRWL